jgi:hypothetical protein
MTRLCREYELPLGEVARFLKGMILRKPGYCKEGTARWTVTTWHKAYCIDRETGESWANMELP